jgi:hypothetical protein
MIEDDPDQWEQEDRDRWGPDDREQWEQDDPEQWERDSREGARRLRGDAARLQDLNVNPAENIAGLRGSLELAVAIAEADSIVKLQRWFPERRPGWKHYPERSGVLGEASVGVEWSYSGVHAEDGAFNGLRATQNDVTVRGFTIMGVDEEDGTFKIRRYIDWAGLFAQLGLTLNWRVPLDDVDVLRERVAAAEAATPTEAATPANAGRAATPAKARKAAKVRKVAKARKAAEE